MVELNVAKEIIIIGFATIFITLGAIAIVITVVGGKNFLQRIENTFSDEKKNK